MPRLTRTSEYCSIARALNLLGERWTLHIVRDLMYGPKRFTDLERLAVGITPKWLTARLRALESEGVLERDGREYKLTAHGERLRPVMEELSLWSNDHDPRPPRRNETIIPEHDMWALEVALNRLDFSSPEPVCWIVQLKDDGTHSISFDGDRWSWSRGSITEEPDVVVTTTSRRWSTLLYAAHARKPSDPSQFALKGRPDRIEQFRRFFGIAG